MPLTVGASTGSVRPIEGLNVTIVPLCTGVPADSVTTARTVVWPFNGKTVLSAVRLMVEPVGEISGTRSHATTITTLATAKTHRRSVVLVRMRTVKFCTKMPVNDNRRMDLAGQPFDFAHRTGNRGYAMAALLVGLSVMAVLMGALLPVWTTMATREKEAELMFRGNQYARAIGLFQRKFANTPPPTIDILVEQRFLRKKYKDPITNDDFQPLYANQAMMPGSPTAPGTSGIGGPQSAQQRPPGGQMIQPGFGATGATAAGGIIGVTSKSKETSLRVYNGRTRYNEWAFVHVQTSQRPGQPGPGAAVPGMGGPNQRLGPQGQPSPFGMPPGSLPNPDQQRPGQPMPPGPFGQPNRPPFPTGGPGSFTTPSGSTTFTPLTPQTRPPGQRPPGQ